MTDLLKTCNTCGKEKPATLENFYINRRILKTGGYHETLKHKCKSCYQKQERERHHLREIEMDIPTKQPPRMKTCPIAHEGCGETLEVTQKNFYMKRKLNDSGRVSVGWSTRCRSCECKYRKKKRKKDQQGYKLKEMETVPAMNAFLYPGRAFLRIPAVSVTVTYC